MAEIRKAAERDVLPVAAIYEHIISEEEAGRVCIGWQRGVYPTEHTAREAIAAGELFVMADGGETVAAARRLYARLGYKEVGIVDCTFNGIAGVKLVCLEKKIG